MEILFYIIPVAFALIVVLLMMIKHNREAERRNNIIESFSRRNDFRDEAECVWYVAREVVGKLGFDDCVIYKLDHSNRICEQVAASGPKAPAGNFIKDPIVIHFGKGIVGSVAESGKSELINNTTKDSRYIPDDDVRYSEVSVPVNVVGKVMFIIDSEAKPVNHFNSRSLELLQKVAEIMASKVVKL